ncbi:hypothetical protein CR513_18113, partial [Mucuna pruriens]
MGGILGQQDDSRKEQAIYYLTKKFTECEQRYPALKRTCCALVWAAKRLRQYMLAHTTWLIAKIDPLNTDKTDSTLANGFVRIVYTNQKVVKGSSLPEQLAHHPLDEYHPLSHEFSNEHIMMAEKDKPEAESDEWKLWLGGASNLLGNRIGVVLASPKGQYFPFLARLGFDCTNNMAEYEACAMGIIMAIEHQINKLKVLGNSALVIYQLRREWETRDAKLIPYHAHIMALSEHFNKISFHYVPRDENQMADALATLSAMLQANQSKEMTIHVRHQTEMAHYQQVEEARADGKPWYHNIREYLKRGAYPLGAIENDKRTLRRLAAGFFLSGVILYKRSAT